MPKPFPPSVVTSLLVKCHRRCCICHRPSGTKMVIHHIDPNGPNTEDNGIPLCLDCHADVRSYDSKHPIGRKFTIAELKKHRDQWFALCSAPPFTPRQDIQLEAEKKPSIDIRVFDLLRTDDKTPAKKLVAIFISRPKERELFLNEVFKQLKSDSEEIRWKMAYVIEELISWDPNLVPASIPEEMSLDESFSVRSSAAVCYYELAFASPASVPLHIVARLASVYENWYVCTPAMACLKRLARSRPLALDIILSRLRMSDEQARKFGAKAIFEMSTVDPWLLEHRKGLIKKYLQQETNTSVKDYLKNALENLNKPPVAHDYPPF